MNLPDFSKFEKKVGINFKNKSLLKQAFTHRSYINENRSSDFFHNERLEFLGDAVLELVITEFLYYEFPEKQEGDLTSYRAALVNTITISKIASDIGMNDFLLLSKGESKDTGRARQVILANTFEALIGALYLDGGHEESKTFIANQLFPKVKIIVEESLWKDPKSVLQEKAQEFTGVTPVYKTLNEVGPDHNKIFTVGLYIGEEFVSEGKGYSKQDAQEDAARTALKKKNWA
ncbi:MAG: ribonuclease III [bacterium]